MKKQPEQPRRKDRAGIEAARAHISMEMYGPCQNEITPGKVCGDALAFHNPCSKCGCPSFVSKEGEA